MKRVSIYCLTATLVLLLLGCGGRKDTDRKTKADTLPLLIMQIQKCSRLYTTEVQLHKIVVHNDTKTINGTILSKDFDVDLPLGTRKVAIPIDATVRAYIDFSTFSAQNIHRQGNKIEIVLPDPKISDPVTKINHDEIKAYVPFLRRRFSDQELARYEQKARLSIINDLPSMGLIETAQINAARTLVPLLQQMGFREQDITITFRKEFSSKEITRMVETGTTTKTKETSKE